MPEPTHLPIQDEALRRARLDEATCDGLRWIAVRISDRRPHALMTADAREALALSAAHNAHPHDRPAADELERALLLRMPHVDPPTTGADYAEILHRATWKA